MAIVDWSEEGGRLVRPKVALRASNGCGIGLAISILGSRGQHDLGDAEPSTQVQGSSLGE